MSKLTPQAQEVLEAFGSQPGVTPEHLKNLATAIEASPSVIEEMNTLVAAGHLKAIAPLPTGSVHAGGVYDDQRDADTIRLPLASLEINDGSKRYNHYDMTFVMGHELEHGLNYKEREDAYKELDRNVIAKLSQPSPRDYTKAMSSFINERRLDEAEGQIAGFNGVVSALRKQHETDGKRVTPEEIYSKDPDRMRDFIQISRHKPYHYSFKPGLTTEEDLSIRSTATNIETIGKNFFDKSAEYTALGRDGQSDYANYYGAYAIGRIAQLEKFYHAHDHVVGRADIALNLSELHLSLPVMQRNGIDLGDTTANLPILDTSHGRQMKQFVQNTGAAPALVPEVASDPLHEELRQRLPPETSADRLAQITLAAKEGGVREGQLGDLHLRADRLFITGSHAWQFAQVDLTGPPPSAEQSQQQLDSLNQREAQQQAQRQLDAQMREPTGPVM